MDEPYRFVLRTYRAAVSQFEQLQPQTQVLRMGDAGKDYMQRFFCIWTRAGMRSI